MRLEADGALRRVRGRREDGLVVGDRVEVFVQRADGLPRETVLRRRDARGRTRAIAANLDRLGVVTTVRPPTPPGYLDRAIVAARVAGIEPFLVVNKCDQEEARELCARLAAAYAPAVEVLAVSAHTGEGLPELAARFGPGHRGALVGTSGVGKSSLTNALVPGLELEVGELNRMTRLGRHQTTRATLHALPDGGELIDTPGFRDFVPADVEPAELAAHFPGFEAALAEVCRFRDCRHRAEPGCGVREAVAAGTLPEARHRAYLALLADLEA